MSASSPSDFGEFLRHARLAAGLSQEELAERAHLSREAIGALERGDRRTPRKATVDLLAEALALTISERAAFEAAARTSRRAATSPAVVVPDPEPKPPLQGDVLPPVTDVPLPQHDPAGLLRSAFVGYMRDSMFLVNRFWQAVKRTALGAVLHKRIVLVVTGMLALALLGGVLLSSGYWATLAEHRQIVCLATAFPTTGSSAEVGRAAQNAAQLAMIQNHDLGAGYRLEFTSYNDASAVAEGLDPQQGAQNMAAIASNRCILGVVGALESGVAAAEIPIAMRAGLALLSPSATNAGLTLRLYAQRQGLNFDALHPPGEKNAFFRISPNDVAQGIVAADFTFDDLAARSVFVVEDGSPYSEELAGGFTQAFFLHGGVIPGSENIEFGDTGRISIAVSQIVAARPDAVFYAGVASGVGQLFAQLDQAGYKGDFVGGDGIAGDSGIITQARSRPDRTIFATQPVRDLSSFTSGAAATFINAYNARYPGQPLSGYSANAYDAAMVLIAAIRQLIAAGRQITRAAMLDQVQNIKYAGITGLISFDNYGDIVHGMVSVYTVQGGQWVYLQQASL